MPPNQGAAPNAGGRPQFTIRTPLTARVGELDRFTRLRLHI